MPNATGIMTCSSSKSASKVTSINDRVATEIRRCCRRRCDFDGTSSAVRTDVMRQSWTLLWVMPGADNVCCRRREHGARIHLRCEERRPALQPSQWRYVNNRVKSRTWSLSIVDPWVFKYNYWLCPTVGWCSHLLNEAPTTWQLVTTTTSRWRQPDTRFWRHCKWCFNKQWPSTGRYACDVTVK